MFFLKFLQGFFRIWGRNSSNIIHFWYSSRSFFEASILSEFPSEILTKNPENSPNNFFKSSFWALSGILPGKCYKYSRSSFQKSSRNTFGKYLSSFFKKSLRPFFRELSGVPSENSPGVHCGSPSQVLTGILSRNPSQVPWVNSLLFLVRIVLVVFFWTFSSWVHLKNPTIVPGGIPCSNSLISD